MTEHLSQINLFRGLSAVTLENIQRAAVTRTYGPGETIIIEGETAESVYFIESGEVRVFRLSLEGREQVLAALGPGTSFNTVSPLVPAEQHSASARAVTASRLIVLRGPDFITLLRSRPDFCFAMLQEFAGRLVHLTGLVENLSLHSVRGRMAIFLLQQADGVYLNRKWTQDEMAENLGSVRDVVGRTLRDFIDAGYIRRDGHRIVLLDRAGLEREAQF